MEKHQEVQAELEKEPLELVPVSVDNRDLSVVRAPEVVLEESKKAASALMQVVNSKPKKLVFNGKRYLEFEDWALLGRFYAITPRVKHTLFIEMGGARGFEAVSEAIHVPTGKVISSAEAMCLNDEENWGKRAKYRWETRNGERMRIKIGEDQVPLFQLKSMAQTRASAKCLRNVLAPIVVLAGYAPTPAEEMKPSDFKTIDKSKKPSKKKSTNKAASPPKKHRSDEIPDEKIPYYVIEFGKYKGLTLSEILGQETDGGKNKGFEYLEWLEENARSADLKSILRRFFKVMEMPGWV
jgi:hypothetical protein